MLTTRRAGFSFLEVLVALAIVAILTAILLPAAAGRINSASSAALSQNLKLVNDGIQKFRENVGHYPSQLVQLTTKPSSGALDACGSAMTVTSTAMWRGPYLSLAVGANGILSGDMAIDNTIARTPANTTSSTVMNGILQLSVTDVPARVANELEATIEKGSDLSHGTIIWFAGTLTFSIPIRGC